MIQKVMHIVVAIFRTVYNTYNNP